MPTPHNNAQKGDFAKTVLMPGDPLRARFIAETYLQKPRLVNEVRGMLAYTGTYRDQPVSVMASGMGMPSMGIYSHELFTEYDVDNIIRIGTAGAVSSSLHVRDVIMALASCTRSTYAEQFGLPCAPAAAASYALLKAADQTAQEMGIKAHIGTVLCTDTFYDESNTLAQWQKVGVLATEMESAALYYEAARAGKQALCICTISDCPLTGESASAEERQTDFHTMIRLALNCTVSL